jgi:hypothetical protein
VAEYDEGYIRSNLKLMRESGASKAEIERRFAHPLNAPPNIRAAYYRVIDAETEAREREPR